MSGMPPKIKTFSVNEAFFAWLKIYSVTEFELSDKFSGDHTLERLSSSQAAEQALRRYQNSNGRTRISTWIDISQDKIIDKARGSVNNARREALSGIPENALAHLRPTVYRGGQQLAACIKCNLRTVSVDNLTRDEAARPGNRSKVTEWKHEGETQYLRCKSTEEEARFWIVGAWQPLESKFNLYHYESYLPTPECQVLPVYCRWSVDPDGNPQVPQA